MRGAAPAGHTYKAIQSAGQGLGFTVTSGYTKSGHNTGSKHYAGRAVDFRTRDKTPAQVEAFIKEMRAKGFRVVDERKRPKGQKVWSGPHVHVEASVHDNPFLS